MNQFTTINAVANAILSISALHLVFRVFGHPESAIWKRPFAAVLCKAATTVTVCGALWNLLTLSSPAPSEVLLNIGIAANFVWISFYHHDNPASTCNSRPSKKASQRNPAVKTVRTQKPKATSSGRRQFKQASH
jgi:hypothetical protein